MARLFISHSSQQVGWCRPFVAALRAGGHTCFYDEDSIPGTAAWVELIENNVRDCDVFVLVLSPVAYASRWVREEVSLVLVKNKPILVVVHEATQVDGLLLTRQWVQVTGLDAASAAQKVLATLPQVAQPSVARASAPHTTPTPAWDEIALPARLDHLGFAGWRDRARGVSFIVPPTVPVPAGKFTMGSAADDPQAYDNEKPQYSIPVGAFRMGIFPLTVAEYRHYLAANPSVKPPLNWEGPADAGWLAPAWRGKTLTWALQQAQPENPVVMVSWFDVRDYAAWLASVTGQPWRLPTEAEWEKAARWDAAANHARIYPWGDGWDPARANTQEAGLKWLTPVGTYAGKGDASPYGCHDMAGNVWQWTSTMWYDRPPYGPQYEKDADAIGHRVLRGGSWLNVARNARAARRLRLIPAISLPIRGGRLALPLVG